MKSVKLQKKEKKEAIGSQKISDTFHKKETDKP